MTDARLPPYLRDILEICRRDCRGNKRTSYEDLAEMYYIVAEYGENKKDYYLGYGKPGKLVDFFASFKSLVDGEYIDKLNVKECPKIFNNELLKDLCNKANSQVAKSDFSSVARRILQ